MLSQQVVSPGSIVPEPWDPTHTLGRPGTWWSRDNVGEAMPGVATALTWSFWGPAGERNARRTAFALGVLSRREAAPPRRDEDRYVRAFYGRIALDVGLLATIGDRLPGVSAPDVIAGLFAGAPPAMTYEPTRRRYPAILTKAPLAFALAPRRIRALAAVTDRWWEAEIAAMDTRDRAAAAATLEAASSRFAGALMTHSAGLMAMTQPLHDALEKLVARTGGDVAALAGSGGAEMAIVEDLWRASRGELGLEAVARRHGFHGPAEGELSSRVWREDPAPLERLAHEYAGRGEEHGPAARRATAARRLRDAQRDVLAATPRLQRPAVRLLLGLAAERLPLRGVGKRAFLQALDVARAAARRIGDLEHAAGRLDAPGDAFHLTLAELTTAWPADAPALVARRRARREAFQALEIPGTWRGNPEPLAVAAAGGGRVDVVRGAGVSAGIAEGPARVVTDPAFAEVEPDEVLIAPTTDPSWASIMFVSAALVVDIGGALSHAAVVARELGLPCVVGTRTGTRAIRTGDRVRVDGATGTVEILARAAPTT